jgi:hypothetical protein
LAWFVDASSTKRLTEMRPFETPSENRIGRRVSTLGMPFGTQRKEVRPLGWSLPFGSS